VDKLLKEHKENQELVRNMGNSHYQIVYPVQLRHHEKMGISTREIGATKVPNPPPVSLSSLYLFPRIPSNKMNKMPRPRTVDSLYL
jgi:hypothetical protein